MLKLQLKDKNSLDPWILQCLANFPQPVNARLGNKAVWIGGNYLHSTGPRIFFKPFLKICTWTSGTGTLCKSTMYIILSNQVLSMHMSFIHHVQIVGTGLLVWRSFEICTICTFWILCILLHRIIAGAHYAWICETGSSSAGLTGAQAEILSRVGKLPKSARDRCCFLTALSLEIKNQKYGRTEKNTKVLKTNDKKGHKK